MLKFICFLISIFVVVVAVILKRMISVLPVFNEIFCSEPVNNVFEIEIYLFVDVFEGLA